MNFEPTEEEEARAARADAARETGWCEVCGRTREAVVMVNGRPPTRCIQCAASRIASLETALRFVDTYGHLPGKKQKALADDIVKKALLPEPERRRP